MPKFIENMLRGLSNSFRNLSFVVFPPLPWLFSAFILVPKVTTCCTMIFQSCIGHSWKKSQLMSSRSWIIKISILHAIPWDCNPWGFRKRDPSHCTNILVCIGIPTCEKHIIKKIKIRIKKHCVCVLYQIVVKIVFAHYYD